MARRVLAVAATAALCWSIAGCSGSRAADRRGPTTTTARPARLTMTAEHVTGVVARYLPALRAALAGERTSCGGAAGIEQADPVVAKKCAESLRTIATGAQELASALVLLRPPDALAARVADTSDAARPVAVVFRSFSTGDCLPTRGEGTPTRSRCDTAGRELAMLIAQLERQLERWP